MVSVIIPTYNRAYCIEKSIMSVLNQTYRDLELIIIDDGSTDNTKEVIGNIKDDRIRYIYQENAGACVARNHGIDEACGEFIAFHDSDDIWRLDKLRKQMDVCNMFDSEIQFCKMANHKNDGTVNILPEHFVEGFCENPTNFFNISTGTVLAKHSLFDEYRFDPDMPKWQEFEFFLRVTQDYKLYCLDEVLYDYYVQDDSISNKACYSTAQILLKKHPDFIRRYPEMSKIISNLLFWEAIQIWSVNRTEALNCLKLSKKYHNSAYKQIKEIAMRLGVYDILQVTKRLLISRHFDSK